ncbi:MAG: hypothetical protein IK093_17110, partial [Ruminiclostridium sp.]|nr:hypothetical protein [Ruminiclostridium sp.]
SIKELSKAGTIVFFFWEDIQSLILSNDALFRLHYPTYIPYLQELNQKSREKAFVERFIDMCSKHEIENILSSFTYNGYFPDSYLDVSDDIENELNTLIHSQEATYVSKDLLSDCYLFLNDFTYYTQQILLLMKPIVNTDSVSSIVCPYRQPTESEKEELDCIQRRMIDIYKKYRWWE